MCNKTLNRLIAESQSHVAPFVVANFDHSFNRVTGFLLGDAGPKPALFYARAAAESVAQEMNALPHAAGRVYVVLGSVLEP